MVEKLSIVDHCEKSGSRSSSVCESALFGAMTVLGARLGELRRILRSIAALDDDDLERLVKWFSTRVNRWGQTPRATGLSIDPRAHRD